MKRLMMLASLALALVCTGAVRAETKVELKGVHLCCPACVGAVNQILKKVDGVSGVCNREAKTITLTAKDDATALQALEALAAGGFHGDTGNKDLVIKDDSGAEKGKVKSLTVVGVHNCCGQCTAGIKKAVKTVAGVTGDTAKAKTDTFEVTGDFDAAELIKALNDAGYHVKVKK
jgi:periplasmic mercuric ion binding protein